MRFYHASATIINDTRRVASHRIVFRLVSSRLVCRVASPAFFAKIANNGEPMPDQPRPDLWLDSVVISPLRLICLIEGNTLCPDPLYVLSLIHFQHFISTNWLQKDKKKKKKQNISNLMICLIIDNNISSFSLSVYLSILTISISL